MRAEGLFSRHFCTKSVSLANVTPILSYLNQAIMNGSSCRCDLGSGVKAEDLP
jgi:hypothetical protein